MACPVAAGRDERTVPWHCGSPRRAAATLRNEVLQILGGRGHACEQQMLPRPRAGDIEQPSLGFVDVI